MSGLFLAPKVYTYTDDKGDICCKAKGVKKENLNNDFYNILSEKN